MLKIRMKKNFNLSKIRLDFSKTLNTGIRIVASDINQGIGRGSQFGKPFKRNAESTIKKKGFDHPLKDTGLMMDISQMGIGKAGYANQRAYLLPNEDRVDIGFWNDQGTNKIPARPFWGISQKAEKNIMAMAMAHIKTEIRRA